MCSAHVGTSLAWTQVTAQKCVNYCGLAHFSLVPLCDQGKAEVLTLRAQAKGYDLPDAVLEYWLRRGPRDLSTLVRDLERLDEATLRHQRLLTVPLLKQVLGY